MIQNSKIHTNRIEDIRRKWYETKEAEWQIAIQWVKEHVGIKGNELADTMAKKATTNETITDSYTRIPKSVVLSELKKESEKKWQRDWTQTTKSSTTKEYFPDTEGRLKIKLNLKGNLTSIVTGHGNMKAYLNRFKLTDEPTCPFGKGDQTTDQIIYDSGRLTRKGQVEGGGEGDERMANKQTEINKKTL